MYPALDNIIVLMQINIGQKHHHIKQEQEKEKDYMMPGPGQYGPDQATKLVRPKTPSWKIGTSLRPNVGGERNVPGVGNYNISQ